MLRVHRLAAAIDMIAAAVTFALRAAKRPYGEDATDPSDYVVEAGDPGVEPLPATADQGAR